MRNLRIFASTCTVVALLALADCSSPQQDIEADAQPEPPRAEEALEESPAHTGDETEPLEAVALTLPRRGTLHVPLPAGTIVTQPDSEVPGTVRLRIEGCAPDPYVALLTVLGVPEMMPGFGADAWLKEELLRWKADVAAADTATPVEFWLDRVHGYYLTLEDPAPEPGRYPYLLQGFFDLDGCIVSFQVLHHQPRATAANRFLALISQARWQAEEDAPAEPVS